MRKAGRKEKNSPAWKKSLSELMRVHGLTKREAGNVLSYDVDLEEMLLRKAMRSNLVRNRHRSCLVDAMRSREPIVLHRIHQKPLTGVVTSIDRYNFHFAESGKPVRAKDELNPPKTELKYAHHPAFTDAVVKRTGQDLRLNKKNLCVPSHPRDRFHVSSRQLHLFLRKKRRVIAKTYDGDMFAGKLKWWGQFELGLDIGNGVEIVLFRHALYDLFDEADGAATSSRGSAEKKTSKSEKPAAGRAGPDPLSAKMTPKAVPPEKKAEPTPRLMPEDDYDPTEDMTTAQAEIWHFIAAHPEVWSIPDVVKGTGRSRQTIDNALTLFLEADLIEELECKGRKRLFQVI